jgi:hypothetical protein
MYTYICHNVVAFNSSRTWEIVAELVLDAPYIVSIIEVPPLHHADIILDVSYERLVSAGFSRCDTLSPS